MSREVFQSLLVAFDTVEYITRIPVIVVDAVVLSITVRQAWRNSRSSALLGVLLRDGT